MAKKKATRKSRPIVIGHLEKISSGVFERYPEQITGLTEGTQGVYALYRRQKLYYIGLASDLKRRIKWHLKDKHKGKWDRFSLYIIRKTDQIREVESVVVRIAEPSGNQQRGRLRGSKNLVRKLDAAIKERQKEERRGMLGDGKGKATRKKVKKRRKRVSKAAKGERPLKGLLRDYQRIYASYKGKDYKAKVLPSGSIKFNGKLYNTPSGAAHVIIERGAVNGWNFWKYKDKSGNLRAIKHLRK
ncbi:hypothetical protein ES703_87550 [subsurface metagenome]